MTVTDTDLAMTEERYEVLLDELESRMPGHAGLIQNLDDAVTKRVAAAERRGRALRGAESLNTVEERLEVLERDNETLRMVLRTVGSLLSPGLMRSMTEEELLDDARRTRDLLGEVDDDAPDDPPEPPAPASNGSDADSRYTELFEYLRQAIEPSHVPTLYELDEEVGVRLYECEDRARLEVAKKARIPGQRETDAVQCECTRAFPDIGVANHELLTTFEERGVQGVTEVMAYLDSDADSVTAKGCVPWQEFETFVSMHNWQSPADVHDLAVFVTFAIEARKQRAASALA